MNLREAIVAEAEGWLRTPFKHRARVRGAGVDCIQLLVAVFESVGLIRGVDAGKYPPDWFLHRADDRLVRGIARVAIPVTVPQPGDIALFQIGRAVAHAGIVVQWPEIIHASEAVGVVREDVLRSAVLTQRFRAWYSIVDAARERALRGAIEEAA